MLSKYVKKIELIDIYVIGLTDQRVMTIWTKGDYFKRPQKFFICPQNRKKKWCWENVSRLLYEIIDRRSTYL